MRILDLFCGAGGAAVGYHRAGFDVVGVDIAPQPHYPFEFHQLDATALRMDALNGCIHELSAASALPGRSGACLGRFDAIHASPPCQASSALTKGTNRPTRAHLHTDLIATTRDALDATGLPYVIENVQGAKIRRDLTLCGESFGLGVIRHRYFELAGFDVWQPGHVKHRGRVAGWRHGTYYGGPYVAVYGNGGGKGSVAQWQSAMGIDWTDDRKSIAEAVPPSYTEYIGRALIESLERAA